jgi:hypothetical protein
VVSPTPTVLEDPSSPAAFVDEKAVALAVALDASDTNGTLAVENWGEPAEAR